MKVAIYPGSFNPMHKGHIDVIEKSLQVFDKVIVARGINPDKKYKAGYMIQSSQNFQLYLKTITSYLVSGNRVDGFVFQGLLKDFVDTIQPDAIIKGLRNGQDFEYEKNQLYWNEDLGITIPTFYIISNRANCHISSSAIKSLELFKGDKYD